MGTSNFHNKNASKIFAVEVEEDYEYDDLVFNLQVEILEQDGYNDDRYSNKALPSFPAKIIGGYQTVIDDYIDIVFEIVIRSGYYKGVNIDYELYIEPPYETYESFEDFNRCSGACLDTKEKVEKEVLRMTDLFEKIAEKYSTPLKVVAVANNGETFYEKTN